jgi:hypothetical protein
MLVDDAPPAAQLGREVLEGLRLERLHATFAWHAVFLREL